MAFDTRTSVSAPEAKRDMLLFLAASESVRPEIGGVQNEIEVSHFFFFQAIRNPLASRWHRSLDECNSEICWIEQFEHDNHVCKHMAQGSWDGLQRTATAVRLAVWCRAQVEAPPSETDGWPGGGQERDRRFGTMSRWERLRAGRTSKHTNKGLWYHDESWELSRNCSFSGSPWPRPEAELLKLLVRARRGRQTVKKKSSVLENERLGIGGGQG